MKRWFTGFSLALLGVSAAIAQGPVLARVQGPEGTIEISADRVRAYLEAHPGHTARAALQDLIDFELLAAEAAKRRFEAADLRADVAPVMVRRLLKDRFERDVARDNLPKKYLERAYEQNRTFFVRPALRDADHILVTVGGELPGPDRLPAARRIAEAIARSFVEAPVTDPEGFTARAPRFEAEAKAAGLELRMEKLGLFPLQGPYDPVFAKAAFAVDEPGKIIGPFETRFGLHVVRINQVLPELNRPYSAVEDELRDRVLDSARGYELRAYTDALAKEHQTTVDMRPLEALEARRGLTGPEE